MGNKTLSIQSGNLFQIAAAQYDDATLWWLIASANGLNDPEVTSPIVLTIPPYNKNYVGGIPI